MKTLLALLFLVSVSFLGAQVVPEVRVSPEVVYRDVRIVGFSGDDVVILHSKGSTNVSAALFDLETLARAHQRIEEESAERKKKTEAATKADNARKAEAVAQGKANEAAVAAAKPPVPATAKPVVQSRRSAPAPTIAQLKASFPPKSNGSARITIVDKTNRNGQVTKSREDVIQYTVPSDDVWSWYRGSFQTTTAEAWPRTLELVEKRIDEDMQRLGHVGGGESARVQAQETQRWLQEVLVPYVKQWRALGR